MTPLLEKLPTILVLAVLVGIFLSLRKHAPSARIRLWTYAWAFIFLHFFIQAFETHTGTLETVSDLSIGEHLGKSRASGLDNRLRRTCGKCKAIVPTANYIRQY